MFGFAFKWGHTIWRLGYLRPMVFQIAFFPFNGLVAVRKRYDGLIAGDSDSLRSSGISVEVCVADFGTGGSALAESATSPICIFESTGMDAPITTSSSVSSFDEYTSMTSSALVFAASRSIISPVSCRVKRAR